MKNILRWAVTASLFILVSAPSWADYAKGTTMFQIYGGGAALDGHYHQPGVNQDEQAYADGGGMLGGQFLYYMGDNPCWALGFDVFGANFDTHTSNQLLTNRFTNSSAKSVAGLVVARLAYPKGHFRPYVQGGLGAQHTSLHLDGTPLLGSTWSDTNTTETRTLLDDGHVGPALEGAIGIHIYFTERFFIGAEFKEVDLLGKDFSPTAAGLHEGLLAPRGSVGQPSIGFMIGLGL